MGQPTDQPSNEYAGVTPASPPPREPSPEAIAYWRAEWERILAIAPPWAGKRSDVERLVERLLAALEKVGDRGSPPLDAAPDPFVVLGRGLAQACDANGVRPGEVVQFRLVPNIWAALENARAALGAPSG
jgi:hypothetical protein